MSPRGWEPGDPLPGVQSQHSLYAQQPMMQVKPVDDIDYAGARWSAADAGDGPWSWLQPAAGRGLDSEEHVTAASDSAVVAVRRAGEAVSRVQRAPATTARAVEDADLLERWQRRDHSDELVDNQAAEAGVLVTGGCDVLVVDAQ